MQLTTANLICHLNKYKKVKDKLQEEIDRNMAPIQDDIMSKLNMEVTDSFEYLRFCFLETLRMEGPVEMSTTSCFFEDVTVGGVNICAGDPVIVNIDYLQHDPKQWQEPWTFIPERFDSDSPYFKRPDGGSRHPLSFGPFLGGQRVCLGKTFAEYMVRFTVSILLWHYEFELVDENQIADKPKMNIGGRERSKIMVKKTERRPLKDITEN